MNQTTTRVKPGPVHQVVRQIREGIDLYMGANGDVVSEEGRGADSDGPVGLSPKDVVVAINLGGYGLALGAQPASNEHLEILAPDMTEEFRAEVQRLYKESQEATGPADSPMLGVPLFGGGFRGAGLGTPGMGQNTLVLPDGVEVNLGEWVYGSFRSACLIDPWDEAGPDVFELFGYGRSQPIAGTMKPSTFVHTNIPRSGDNGLPRDWEMLAYRWNAMASLPLDQGVLDFTNRVSAHFHYNDKMYRDVLLTELLLGGGELAGDPGAQNLPCHLREGLSYKVILQPASRAVMDDFRAYLRDSAASKVDPVTMAELEMLARQDGGELARVVRKLKPGRQATFWVQLSGYVRRTVV